MRHTKYVALTLVVSIFIATLVACSPAIKVEGISVTFVERDINENKLETFLDISNIKVKGEDGEKPTVKDAIIYALEDQNEDYDFDDEVLEEAFNKEYDVDTDKKEYNQWIILLNDKYVEDPEDETISDGDEIECVWVESVGKNPEIVYGEESEIVTTIAIRFVNDEGEVLLEHPSFSVVCSTKETPTALMAAEQVLNTYEQVYSLTDNGGSFYSITLSGIQYHNDEYVDEISGYYKYWNCEINGEELVKAAGDTPIYSDDSIVFEYKAGHSTRYDTTASGSYPEAYVEIK